MRTGAKAAPKKKKGKKADAISMVYAFLQTYVDVPEDQHVALALWILWTHVCNRYQHAPRIVVTSATPECGKSSVFKIILAFGP